MNTFNEKYLQDISDKIFALMEKKIEEKFKQQSALIEELQSEVSKLHAENYKLMKYLDDQEQMARSKNLRIFGIEAGNSEETDHKEDLVTKITDLFTNKLNVPVRKIDIAKCHRIPNRTPNNKQSAVLVRLANYTIRENILKSRKLLKNTGVQIKEDLTKSRLKLFKKSIDLYTKDRAWVYNGNIYIKSDDKVCRVTTEQDLLALK